MSKITRDGEQAQDLATAVAGLVVDGQAGDGVIAAVDAVARHNDLHFRLTDYGQSEDGKRMWGTLAVDPFRLEIAQGVLRWECKGVRLFNGDTPVDPGKVKLVGESAYTTKQESWAYTLRSIFQAVGNATFRIVEPLEAGGAAINLSQLRQDAEKATDAVIATLPDVAKATITPEVRLTMVEANYQGLLAAKAETRAKREADAAKKANGGLPPRGAPGAYDGVPVAPGSVAARAAQGQ